MNRERQIKKEGGRGNRKQWGGEEEEIGKNERDRKKERIKGKIEGKRRGKEWVTVKCKRFNS